MQIYKYNNDPMIVFFIEAFDLTAAAAAAAANQATTDCEFCISVMNFRLV